MRKKVKMITPLTRGIGLFFSIATCAVMVLAHTKTLLTRHPDKAFNSELTVEWGAESAWPHLRQDMGQ